jgi:hypothetical protein
VGGCDNAVCTCVRVSAPRVWCVAERERERLNVRTAEPGPVSHTVGSIAQLQTPEEPAEPERPKLHERKRRSLAGMPPE